MLDSQVSLILGEIASGGVLLTCGKHQYVAARKRKSGSVMAIPPNPDGPSRSCPKCWECFFVTDYCLTLPKSRLDRLEELDEVIHHLVEFVAKGKFDFVPDINPTIKYHKDAADDLTGEDKRVIITDSEEVN